MSVKSRISPLLLISRQTKRIEWRALSHINSYTFCGRAGTQRDSKVLARQPPPRAPLRLFGESELDRKTGMKFRALPMSLFEAQRSSHFAENRKIVDPRIDWIEVLSIRRVSSKRKSLELSVVND